MKYFLLPILIFILSCTSAESDYDPTGYVNPFIGTGQVDNKINGGNTYPGAVRPWGMASMNPHTLDFREKVASTTYRKNNPYIYGFGHAHVSGMGCNASGAILLKATGGTLDCSVDHSKTEYSNEEASPGYYAVHLDRFDIGARFTSSERCGLSRFTFPEGKANLIFDLGLTPDFGKYGSFEFLSETTFQGFKTEGNTCDCGKWGSIYFYGKLSKKPESRGFFKDWKKIDSSHPYLEDEYIGAYYSFETSADEVIEVRVGISYVSMENAKLNFLAETEGRSFESIREESHAAWKEELSKIVVEGGSDEDKSKFYTGLYHSLLHPNIFSDVNGEYKKHDSPEIGRDKHIRYTNFSMWDTYRTLHPLLSLVYPGRQEDMLYSLVEMYEEAGWLPRIEVNGYNTGVMVGDPASIIINDSYQKGISGFDTDAAMDAMIKSATYSEGQNINRRAFQQYMEYGYIPQDNPGNDSVFAWFNDLAWGTVSTALEFCLADWNIARYLESHEQHSLAGQIEQQSLNYKNLFDPETGFMRPRESDGDWYEPFDPLEDSNTLFNRHMRGGPGFVEGSAWNYLFFVPHDIPGLMGLLGGEENFVSTLQTCFDQDYYDATNEPNIAFPFLFNYVEGEEWRSQQTVRKLIERHFTADENGLPGNDDTGTMSAWLVFAMMGIYPDCPGDIDYQIVVPSFNRVSIRLDKNYYSGDEFILLKSGSQNPASFIQSKALEGSDHPSYSISHDQIVKGGRLEIVMGAE